MTERSEVIVVPLDDLVPDPFGLRVSYDAEVIHELAASLDLHGVRVPLLVRQVGDRFQVVDGNYRYHAARHRGLREVPCTVDNLSDEEALEIAAVANWQRADFSFLDRANMVQKLKVAGFSDERISTRLGVTLRQIRRYLAYEEYVPDDVKKVPSFQASRLLFDILI